MVYSWYFSVFRPGGSLTSWHCRYVTKLCFVFFLWPQSEHQTGVIDEGSPETWDQQLFFTEMQVRFDLSLVSVQGDCPFLCLTNLYVKLRFFFSFALLITQFKGRCSGLKYFITYLIESLWGFTFLFESVVCIVDTKCVHSSNLTSSLLNLVFVSIYGGICLLYSDVHALWYVWKEAVALYLLGALILVLICWNS